MHHKNERDRVLLSMITSLGDSIGRFLHRTFPPALTSVTNLLPGGQIDGIQKTGMSLPLPETFKTVDLF